MGRRGHWSGRRGDRNRGRGHCTGRRGHRNRGRGCRRCGCGCGRGCGSRADLITVSIPEVSTLVVAIPIVDSGAVPEARATRVIPIPATGRVVSLCIRHSDNTDNDSGQERKRNDARHELPTMNGKRVTELLYHYPPKRGLELHLNAG